MTKKEKNQKVIEVESLYKKLRNDRIVLNWEEFADKIGYDRTYVSRVMNGHLPFTIEFENAIRDAFQNETPSVALTTNAQEEKLTFTKAELITLFKEIANATSQKVETEMKETQKTQEKHNEFLQGLVSTNLKDTLQAVQDAHHELLTHIKAFERWEALRRTNGDKKKAKTLLAELGTIVGDVDAELISIGNPSTLSNQSSD